MSEQGHQSSYSGLPLDIHSLKQLYNMIPLQDHLPLPQ